MIGQNPNTAVVLYACMILFPRPTQKERGMEAEDAPSITLSALFVTGFVKRGLIADPSSTYLEICSLTCEYGVILKLGPNTPSRSLLCYNMKVIT